MMEFDAQQRRRVQQLLRKLSDESLSDAEWVELDALLTTDPVAIELYVKQQLQEALLQREFAGAPSISAATHARSPCDAKDKTLPLKIYCFFAQPTPFSMTVAAAVIGVFVAAMAFLTPPLYRTVTSVDEPPEIGRYEIVAELTGLREVEWADEAYHRGAFLVQGNRLHLKQGLVELTFRNGAQLVLEGPAQFEIGSPRADSQRTWSDLGTLQRGKLAAQLKDIPSGLAVSTPWGAVVHIGTEFGIGIAESGETEVVVFDGEVELWRKRQGPTQTLLACLKAGDTAQVSATGDFGEGDDDPQSFVRPQQFADITQQQRHTIAHWKFDGAVSLGAGRVPQAVRDHSGRGNHLQWYSGRASYHSAAGPQSAGKCFDAARSLSGDSILFLRGSVDRGDEHIAAIHRQFAVREFTVEGYFRTRDFDRGDLVTYGDRFMIYVEDGRLHFKAGGSQVSLGDAGQFSDDRWHYFVAMCQPDGDGNHLELGAQLRPGEALQMNSRRIGNLLPANRNLCIGGDVFARGENFVGLIDDVRFSSTRRGPEQLLIRQP